MKLLLFLFALVVCSITKIIDKSSAYGDEQIIPAPYSGGAAAQIPVEQAPVSVKQHVSTPDCGLFQPPSQPSGYRAKRNSYEDEPVTPPIEAAAPAAHAPEQAPVDAKQYVPVPECGPVQPPAQSSGYRLKRNSYGDEQITPSARAAAPAVYAPPEQPVEVVEQLVADSYRNSLVPPAEPSGY